MQLRKQDFKKNLVHVRITDPDDFWYLSQILEPGDFVKGKATRKVKIGDTENAKVARKTFTVTIEAETIELTDTGLRINGTIKEGPEDLPRDSYQAISLELQEEYAIEKPHWLSYHKQKLHEAAEQKFNYLLLLFDREEALFALTKKFGYQVLVTLQGDVPKKQKQVATKGDFQQELIKALETYDARYTPEAIILASPAFYKEDLLKKISDPDLRKKIVLSTCSSISEAAIDEVLKRPELAQTLKSSRARQEQLLVEELLQEINKENCAAYGWKEVHKATAAGAVKKLLLTNNFIKTQKEKKTYTEVDEAIKHVDSLQGEIHILTSELEPGKRVDGLGGIAAILRYKMR